jgi:hypothetical protein
MAQVSSSGTPNPWATVADDAVKIGLGALIGGMFTLIGTILSSRRRLRETLAVDCREQLRDIADKFTTAAKTVFDISFPLFAETDRLAQDSNVSKEKFIELKERATTAGSSLGPQLDALDQLEARLQVLGLRESASSVSKYREQVLKWPITTDLFSVYAMKTLWDAFMADLEIARTSVIDAMAKNYR